MQYFGGKARIAGPLAQFLNSRLQPSQSFVDLFCGSCNIVSKINKNRIRIANDIHKPLIELHKAVQSGHPLPDFISEQEYNDIKLNKDKYREYIYGFVGFGLSYAGKWWGGYCRDGTGRNYCLSAKNSLLKKHKTLKNVYFENKSYEEVKIPDNSLIYCDIPYKNTTQYSDRIDHEYFYKWAVEKSKNGFDVYVSEYIENLPEGWEVVWSCESKKDIRNREGTQQKTTEILMSPYK